MKLHTIVLLLSGSLFLTCFSAKPAEAAEPTAKSIWPNNMDPELAAYMPRIVAPIQRRWQACKHKSCPNSLCSVVKFKILKSGTITDLKVIDTGFGFHEKQSMARRALACINKSRPFEKLPENAGVLDITVKMTFLADGEVRGAYFDNN